VAKKRSKQHLNALSPGFLLHWYEIKEVIGQGGFGITYLANDNNLAHEVAIKEYMPVDLAARAADGSVVAISPAHEERYRWGLERFIEEARTIGQFKHPNIVRARNVFEANNTAYMVMDYELGESLQEILSRRKILDEEDIRMAVFPIIDGMKQVHAHGFIHRDIKPGNIFMRVDGEPVLLDFGSARQALENSRGNMTSLFSKGYAPIEQYNSRHEQGSWTDIYGLGATMYRAIAGVPPADAIDRSSAMSITGRDTYVPATEIGTGRYSPALLEAIDCAMKFRRQDRPQTISEWQSILQGRATEAPPVPDITERPAGVSRPQSPEIPARTTATVPMPKPARGAPRISPALASKLNLAEEGDPDAQAAVAFMYAKGVETDKDEAEALKWFRKAAEQDNLAAQYNLGVIYANGRGVEANQAEALKWYLRAAEKGDTTAQATVADMYRNGTGTAPDFKLAFDWNARAAKRGHRDSLFHLGEAYWNGRGVDRNPVEAFRWYKKAALKGHLGAQVNVAYMYGKGEGVDRNDVESLEWYRRAAESGNPNAQFNLGVIYAKGRGTEKNVSEARKWYQMAANQGDANAERALQRLGAA
jgi:TPR repeat protein